jgi:AraC-like DNA-binding protein
LEPALLHHARRLFFYQFMIHLPESRFDTRDLPSRIGLDMWRDQISVLFDARVQKADQDRFFASVHAWLVDDVGIGHVRGSAQQFSRSRHKIARDGMDGYVLQFYSRGESMSRDDNSVARPADLYLIDMARPLATITTEHAQLSIAVPRRLLAPLLKTPDDCHELVLPARLPLVSLLRDTCASFAQNLTQMSTGTARLALPSILQLAAAAVNAEIDEEKEAAVRMALADTVRRHVETHLLEPDLSAETVMKAFGLSRRTLYRLFEGAGGFKAYVQRQRLRRAWHALRAPEASHLSIAAIADMHGFANPESFTRSFRTLFDLTPREARHLPEREVVRHRRAKGPTDWTQWLAQIGR